MNRVMLIGRLTAKPELRYTGANLPFSRFTVAINRTFSNAQGQRETDFINVVVWRKQAENVCNFLNKGSLVSVEGRLQTGSYDDKDGNKRYTMDVVADSVQFLESKSQSQNRGQDNIPDVTPYDYQDSNNEIDGVSVDSDPFADFGDSVSIDENFLD
ncbi:MAG: single-stranded DNA-binding protein [Clostridium sp.]|nr:single-stranded DNA-binding protein [Clostridium sp.]MCM1443802.1 single-stranded DNA-binding protein [Candidatus Amulumruptor caecigallinarius]